MFLIRCTFWLGLVFVALPDHPDFPRSQPSVAATGGTVVRPLAIVGAGSVSGKVADYCAKHPARCLELAAKAQALAAKAGGATSLRPADLAPPWRGAARQ